MAKRPAINIFNQLKSHSKPIPPVPKGVWYNPLYFIGFGFGAGAIPVAPGTFGTLIAIPFYWLCRNLPLSYYLGLVVCLIIFASWLSDYLSRQLKTHDHPGMCIDEFVGFFVTMINAPIGWGWIILGFVLFRIFDIWKPWPIGWIDKRVHGGFGMVLDDVAAGMISMALIQLTAYII
jgi:phosphatidylglycerophosphatase A